MELNTLERTHADLEARSAHVLRLLAALAPDPRAWEYTGDVIDTGAPDGGKCACGHPVRYLFPLRRGEDTANVGSTCVEHFSAIDPDLHDRLSEALARNTAAIAEAKAAARKAAALAEVAQAREEWSAVASAIRAQIAAAKARDRWIPRNLWEIEHYLPGLLSGRKAERFTRPADQKRWYRDAVKTLNRELSRVAA